MEIIHRNSFWATAVEVERNNFPNRRFTIVYTVMLDSSRKRRSHATDRVNVPVYCRKNNKLEHDIQTLSTTRSSNTKRVQRYSGSFVEFLSGPCTRPMLRMEKRDYSPKNEGREEGFESVIVPGNSLTIKSDAAVEFRHWEVVRTNEKARFNQTCRDVKAWEEIELDAMRDWFKRMLVYRWRHTQRCIIVILLFQHGDCL